MSTCDIRLFNCMYGWGNVKGIGNQILRNVNSSSLLTRMICCLSDSGSCPEWYSKLPCDDPSLDLYSVDSLESCSDDDDMASIQGSGTLAGVSCSFVPQNVVPVKFQIR